LETAKEELQSSNEELVTLNEQLQNRNSELGQLSADLGNVLSGVNIPIVILGGDRRIRRFTPPAENLLGLIAGDIGRPIGKLRIGINIPDLDDLISMAIDRSEEAAREVQTETGQWYSLRVRPFIGAEEKVQGVLMAFVNIDELKRLQKKDAARADTSEATVNAVMDCAGQAILAVSRDSRIILANATAETMFGYSRDVLLGQSVMQLLPKSLREAYPEHSASWFEKPQNLSGLELTACRKDGSEFPIQVNLSSIVANGETRGVAFVSDITERKKNELALAEYRNQLALEVDSLDRLRITNENLWQSHELAAGLRQMVEAGAALMGADMGNIQLLNPQKRVLEIVAQRGFGPEFLEHFREVSAADTSACGRSLRTGNRIIIEDVELDADYAPHRAIAAATGYRAVQSTPLLGRDGTPIGMFSTHFRKPHRPAELELIRFDLYASQASQFIERLRSDEQLQRLTRALLLSQEEGNRAVARELHDVFSQELVGIGMEMSSLKREGGTEAQQVARLAKLSEDIVDLAKRLHQISRRLHPAVLEDLGLEPALQQECESFESSQGIPAEFSASNVPAKLPLAVSASLYRVAQEALRNVQQHAPETDRVWVSLQGSPGGVTLTIKDQGNGFELDKAMRKGGLGLISMEERVRAENGKLTIQSEPGKGTSVTAFVPLEDRPDGSAS
jgi:PAS domain S-box-containing protein